MRRRLQTELPEVFVLLSTLLTVGIGIEEAVEYARKVSRGKVSQKYLAELRNAVRDGSPISSVYRDILPAWLTMLLQSAEMTGELPLVFQNWAAQMTEQRRWRSELLKKASYPLVLLAGTVITMVVIGTVVLPQFERMYGAMGLPVPATTLIIASIWGVLPKAVSLTAVLFALLWLATRLWRGQPSAAWNWLCKRLPGTQLIRIHRTYQLSFALALLTEAGVPLLDGVSSLSRTKSKNWLTTAAEQIAKQVTDGATLSQCFRGDYDSMLALQMSRAEVSGDLPDALRKTEIFTRQEFARRVDRLQQWLEPAMSLMIGLLVGGTMFSLYVPMYTLISNVAG
ncbi:type II secretion system F family protein [Alicyclobacillus ferrooxydans]|nr:type II secretion system F family protein [Alicyclobacillus ferrooxydans]